MALTHRTEKNWRTVIALTIIAAGFGFSFSTIRMATGLMPFSWAEVEHSIRTAAFIGFCVGTFMLFFVYSPRGASIRRLGFIKGWIVFDTLSTLLIAAAILSQRAVYALIHTNAALLTEYFNEFFLVDMLVAFLVFLLITFVLQLRRLLGEGIMWKVMTGRYHLPRQENRIYMFLDIKDSTAMAVQLGDERTHALITEVFFDADRQITEHNGEILSYNGDELVATWPETVGLKDSRCLRCYAAITRALDAKSDYYQQRYGFTPALWAGLHTGSVVVGECGDSKLSIVHIGDTPNTAARLEHQAKDMGHDCLISETLASKMELPSGLRKESLGAVTLRGHDRETKVFALERDGFTTPRQIAAAGE